jgi:hypothetical protein
LLDAHSKWFSFAPVPPGSGFGGRRDCGSYGGPVVRYGMHVRNDHREGTPPLVRLKAVCGTNDDGAPCLTVMILDED